MKLKNSVKKSDKIQTDIRFEEKIEGTPFCIVEEWGKKELYGDFSYLKDLWWIWFYKIEKILIFYNYSATYWEQIEKYFPEKDIKFINEIKK